jgi:Asp-tRNA(Asn)/Glu-tRNA(Gln) amidotransferase A subunit family amidase
VTATALVDWYTARIRAHNDSGAELHAVVTVNPQARAEAKVTDEYLAATGNLLGPLHGVPVLVKDQVETAGIRTTFGSILSKIMSRRRTRRSSPNSGMPAPSFWPRRRCAISRPGGSRFPR